MSNHTEGFKMDPKLAETIKRINAEHPAPQDVPEKKRDLFEEMYPLLAKKLKRGKDKDGGAAKR